MKKQFTIKMIDCNNVQIVQNLTVIYNANKDACNIMPLTGIASCQVVEKQVKV